MTKADIQAMFDNYNREFFGGELPAIEIRLEKRKTSRVLGQYRKVIKRNFVTGEVTVLSKCIRIFPLAVASGLEETLFHEMTHYFLDFKNWKHGHTPMFKAIMSRFLGKQVRRGRIIHTHSAQGV